MQKGKIGVTTENIFPIIKKFLYSEHDIFLRELVSNGVDATQKLKTLASIGDFKGELGDTSVRVSVDAENKTITIEDRGIGMTEEEVEKYINQIAFSGAEEFLEKYKDENAIIGHFGLGFYSSFMVAKNVEMTTKSYREGSKAVKWSCDGSPEYTLVEADKESRGTEIKLFLDDDSEEFSTENRINELLNKYCKFLPIPVIFGKEQEWKEDKMIDTDNDKVINITNPLWTRTPSEIKEEEYLEFYNQLYPSIEAPLFHIHLNVDYPFHLTGILYFPKIHNNFDVQKNKIQLYCNQVFVTDAVSGIVPDFLTLLNGVIDSPDIPLNVSRSYLQGDPNVKKISSHITKKVADKLQEIFNTKREDFESKWDDMKMFMQYGIISDEKFAEKAEKFYLHKNIDGKYFTFEEYKEVIKANQTDKHDNVICLYTNNVERQHSFVKAAQNKGYDVLVMDTALESHFIGWSEQKHDKMKFVRVDADIAEKLIEKDVQVSMSLTKEQQDTLTPVFQSQLPSIAKINYTVSFVPLQEKDTPIVITQNEFMRRMRDMAAVGGENNPYTFYAQMPESYNISINGNHPLVIDVFNKIDGSVGKEVKEFNSKLDNLTKQQKNFSEVIKDKKDDDLSTEEKDMRNDFTKKIDNVRSSKDELLTKEGNDIKLVGQLVDLALLSNGMLKGEALTNFISRSVDLIAH
ncbi:MAG: molecular chaperone HtpG [Bacteroidetes bacterium]|nr:molecular chaperone HtpG [Bacteroidota bacterium]